MRKPKTENSPKPRYRVVQNVRELWCRESCATISTAIVSNKLRGRQVIQSSTFFHRGQESRSLFIAAPIAVSSSLMLNSSLCECLPSARQQRDHSSPNRRRNRKLDDINTIFGGTVSAATLTARQKKSASHPCYSATFADLIRTISQGK
jgi:hypothetical protein